VATNVVAVEAPTPPPPAQDARRRFPLALPLWLLFAGLTGAIFYVLLINCDIAIGQHVSLLRTFGINACVSTFATPDSALRRQQLQGRIEQAELDLARLQGDCEKPQQAYVPPQPQPPPPPVTPPKPPTDAPRAQDICTELQARGVSCRPDAKLQISLGWKGPDDLDLHVFCPGSELWFSNKGACGGQHYVDTVSPTPGVDSVENADWTRPPSGHYRIAVKLFAKVSQGPSAFTIIIKCGNEPIREVPGRLSTDGQMVTVAELDYPACK
jgi:hypothetical protein